MNSSAITMIKWLQGSESLFMAAFADGTMMIFDKDKEDETFHPMTSGYSSTLPPSLNRRKHYSTGSLHIHHSNASTATMEAQQKYT